VNRARILLVDDEPAILEGIQRLLRKQYDITLANGGQAALDAIDDARPFAVIVSDMRMPGLSGAQLLARFYQRTPDTVRMLLTGQADLDAAISAVNDGHLFRFLTKPCPYEQFAPALAAAVEQHRLITAERVLLEQTLLGITRALTELLALLDPRAFAAAARQHERVREVAKRLQLKDAWQAEIASMLSSVGYAVLPGEVLAKVHSGATLDEAERGMLARVPEIVERVLGNIPRLEAVREVLRHQARRFDGERTPGPQQEAIPAGARILKAVADLGAEQAKTGSADAALRVLYERPGEYDPKVLEVLAELCGSRPPEIKHLPLKEVRIGMVLANDVTTRSGTLLVAKGQRVTLQLLDRLKNFDQRVGVNEPIPCEVDADTAGA
jgi:response regulator RpfG family c-di-GMP phosphodiesterase